MSQPEIWVSISIRDGHDGADQSRVKVLDLRITGAALGDTEVMSAVPAAALAAPERGPVVNIVIGGDADDTAARPDGPNGEVLAGHRGNGGCVGSFGGHRSAQSAGRVRNHGASTRTGIEVVPSLFGGGSGGAGGDGVTIDENPAGSSRGHGGLRGKGWTGADGRGGQSGAVSPVGYQSIAFAGFVGANQGRSAGEDDTAPGGETNGAEVNSDETAGMGAIGEDDRRRGDAVSAASNGVPPDVGYHWGRGLSATNGYQGPED
jgi:hypothetical protein